MTSNKKKHNNKGFSFTEMLVALLIVVLVSLVMANGISSASTVYHSVIDKANAQMLLSTTITELRTYLSDADGIMVSSDKKTISFSDPKTNNYIEITSTENGIMLSVGGQTGKLVSSAAETKNLHAECEFTAPDIDGIIKIKNITVYRKTAANSRLVCAGVDEYLIKNW